MAPPGEAATPRPAASTVSAAVDLRDLTTLDEFQACVELQRAVWGEGFGEVVPAALLKVSQQVGGVAAAAFTSEGEVVGFVYGLTGIRNGRPSHWSHMLGVRSSHRALGIGLRLKLFQRQRLLAQDVREMRWTFDPLVAGNAHFNLNLVGAAVEAYVAQMYGDTGSGFHTFGTDRLIARWNLDDPPGASPYGPDPVVDWDAAPVLNPDRSASADSPRLDGRRPPAVRIRIPRNVFVPEHRGQLSPLEWRRTTRQAFLQALDHGYRVAGFARSENGLPCHYLLRRSADAPGS
jgi:predicted GNAT superfamily acetyltransferase